MPLPKTFVASPPWIAQQNPKHWLTKEETEIWTAWQLEKRRSEWLAGRLAAKKLLWDEWGLAPREWFVGRDGVAPAISGPHLPHIILSLSHSDGFGAATFSERDAEGSAGVDIQRVRPVHSGLCARVFTSRERQQITAQFGSEDSADGMLLLWALKEAAIKARRQPWGRALQSAQVQLMTFNEARVIVAGEPAMKAQYLRLGDWWLARAVQPLF